MHKHVDYGPLTALIGEWRGDQGIDISPEPDGTEHNPYYETIVFSPACDTDNAEEQCLVAVHYRQTVRRKSNDEVFHDQTGYWIWDAAVNKLMQSLAIPRGVCILAGSEPLTETSNGFTVSADISNPAYTIVQSPFMQHKAKTTAYSHTLQVHGDRLQYSQSIMLDIYGRVFEHKDENVLQRVANPASN